MLYLYNSICCIRLDFSCSIMLYFYYTTSILYYTMMVVFVSFSVLYYFMPYHVSSSIFLAIVYYALLLCIYIYIYIYGILKVKIKPKVKMNIMSVLVVYHIRYYTMLCCVNIVVCYIVFCIFNMFYSTM